MYKLILFLLLSALFMQLHALQTDEELAMHALFQTKHAVNRAAHASAQQLDRGRLSSGIPSIDEAQAHQAAIAYLQDNLRLDESLLPRPGTFWRSRVQVLALDIINDVEHFPYRYERPEYDYSVTLNRPGVVLIIRMDYPRTFRVLGPISWTVKGTSELVY
jgi:hypothetical protein